MIAPKTSTQEGKSMRSLLVVVSLFCLTFAGCSGSGGESNDDGGAPATNEAPIANAGPDQNVTTDSTVTVTLDGSGSSDADGDPLSYDWIFVSRPPGSSAALSDGTVVNPTFIADVGGSYVLSLVVGDGTVASAEDTVLINTIADYSSLFLKAPQTLIFRNGDIILAGSKFSLEIKNTSSITFVCTRVELHNGVSVEGFNEDPAELSVLLGGDQIIDPNEVVGITFTLSRDVPAGDFQLRYYLTRTDTDEEFIVFHQYDLSSQ
jgi:hypothetical protein